MAERALSRLHPTTPRARSLRRRLGLLLALAGGAAALSACDPGQFPQRDPRTPPVAEPEGSSPAKAHHHGAQQAFAGADGGAD